MTTPILPPLPPCPRGTPDAGLPHHDRGAASADYTRVPATTGRSCRPQLSLLPMAEVDTSGSDAPLGDSLLRREMAPVVPTLLPSRVTLSGTSLPAQPNTDQYRTTPEERRAAAALGRQRRGRGIVLRRAKAIEANVRDGFALSAVHGKESCHASALETGHSGSWAAGPAGCTRPVWPPRSAACGPTIAARDRKGIFTHPQKGKPMPQAPRTSTKAVEAMEELVDISHRIHADGRIDPCERREYEDALLWTAYLVGKSDAQIDAAMVAMKSGPVSDRFKQVQRDFGRTYGNKTRSNVVQFPGTETPRHHCNGDGAA